MYLPLSLSHTLSSSNEWVAFFREAHCSETKPLLRFFSVVNYMPEDCFLRLMTLDTPVGSGTYYPVLTELRNTCDTYRVPTTLTTLTARQSLLFMYVTKIFGFHRKDILAPTITMLSVIKQLFQV